MRKPQGVASLALGYVLHWAFSPPLLNPKLELIIYNDYKILYNDMRSAVRRAVGPGPEKDV